MTSRYYRNDFCNYPNISRIIRVETINGIGFWQFGIWKSFTLPPLVATLLSSHKNRKILKSWFMVRLQRFKSKVVTDTALQIPLLNYFASRGCKLNRRVPKVERAIINIYRLFPKYGAEESRRNCVSALTSMRAINGKFGLELLDEDLPSEDSKIPSADKIRCAGILLREEATELVERMFWRFADYALNSRLGGEDSAKILEGVGNVVTNKEELIESLIGENKVLERNIAYVLSSLGRFSLPSIYRLIENGDKLELAFQVLSGLSSKESEEALPIVLKFIERTEDAALVYHICKILEKQPFELYSHLEDRLLYLLTLMNYGNSSLVSILAGFGDRIIPKLHALLSAEKVEGSEGASKSSKFAATVIGEMGESGISSIPNLLSVIEDQDFREEAIKALVKFSDFVLPCLIEHPKAAFIAEAVPSVVENVKIVDDIETCGAILVQLSKLGNVDICMENPLFLLVSDESKCVFSMQSAIRFLSSGEESQRDVAAALLAKMCNCDANTTQALVGLSDLKDRDFGVNIAVSLGKKVVKLLVSSIRNSDNEIDSSFASQVLAMLGPTAFPEIVTQLPHVSAVTPAQYAASEKIGELFMPVLVAMGESARVLLNNSLTSSDARMYQAHWALLRLGNK